MKALRGIRFEDIKQYPEQTLRAVCKKLNIAYEADMLEQEVSMTDRFGHTVRNFDKSPFNYDLSELLSDFDRMRLNIFYEPIHKYYGYPSFDSNEYYLDEDPVRKLFAYPFRFERFLYKGVSFKDIHSRVQGTLQGEWQKKITCPRLIKPDMSEEEVQENG